MLYRGVYYIDVYFISKFDCNINVYRFNNLNNKWLRPMLVRQSHTKKLIDPKLLRAHTKITVNDAIEMVRGEKSKVLAVKR